MKPEPEQIITATLVKHLSGWTGDASLYKLSEPITYEDGRTTDHVIVSATVAMITGPETYIFPADSSGEVLDWRELPGSFRGDLDHAQAIENAGWELV